MTLSILIITWNSENDIVNCLDSVVLSTQHIDREILVWDNGSSDATLDLLRRYDSDISVRHCPKNQGVAVARNRLLSSAKGDVLWILDIDTIVNKEAVDESLLYLTNNPDVGICAPILYSLNGEVQESCRPLPSFKEGVLRNLYGVVGKKYPCAYKGQTDAFEVGFLIGASQFIRKEVVEQVGLLDENIFYGPEAADFCLRAKTHGWKIVCLPYVSLIHKHKLLSELKRFSKANWKYACAIWYYFRKNGFYGKCNSK